MKKTVALLLCLSLLLALPLLVGCQKPSDSTVRVWTLNGTTGFGMAPLVDAASKGETALSYEFTVEAAATNVRDALINGSADIGALPTNMASSLYNATNGEILLLALNTRGVLYLLANTDRVATPATLAELSGKTVYVPAQNPTFITKALLEKAEVANVTLDSTTYAEPAALQTALSSGMVDYAVLPEPMVTIAKAKATQAGVSLSADPLDLTAEWDKYFPEDSLVQGCVVVRKAFAEQNPTAVAKFLEEYEASIRFVTEKPAEAAPMIAAAGIFAQAPVAQKAIPNCNLCFVAGEQMKDAMNAFLTAMPLQSIGGKLPDDAFYYVQK